MTNTFLNLTRRSALLSAGAAAATAATTAISPALTFAANAAPKTTSIEGNKTMAYVTTKDGVEIFYKDWGPKDAQPIVFHHGWPLSSDDWDARCCSSCRRVIALSLMTAAVTAGPRR